MSQTPPLLQRYRELGRAKRRGRWRFPLWVCFTIFILLSPAILIVEGSVCVGIMVVMHELPVPPVFALAALFVSVFVVAYLLAQVIYFALRVGAVEDGDPRCRSCGYNLTGNVSGRCPECGQPIAAEPSDIPERKP